MTTELKLPRIYLDNAATSYPKPPEVWDAVDRYQRLFGSAVGRSAYREAVDVQAMVDRCRRNAAELFHAEGADRIVFSFNGTDSLNIALHGLLRPGDHVVASNLEHNSVLRPLRRLRDSLGVKTTFVAASPEGFIDPAHVRAALRPTTRLIALNHASNVIGTIQPVADVGDIARKAGVLFLVDAAQSAGHVEIDLRALSIDMLACPGHKGLLGPLGTGLLYLRPGIEEQIDSYRQGGTGSASEDDRQPESLPDKYESGNHNAPGLAGLDAALVWLRKKGVEAIRRHEQELTARLLAGLAPLAGVTLYGPASDAPPETERLGVVSLNVGGFDPQILAGILDETFHLQTRAGLHCAPGAHRTIGTMQSGGTVRLSLGPLSTAQQVDAAVAAIAEVSSSGN